MKNLYERSQYKLCSIAALALAICSVSNEEAHAQSTVLAPMVIGESGAAGVYMQPASSSVSFLFSNPTTSTSSSTNASAVPYTYGFSEAYGGGPGEQQIALSGLSLSGGAYFTSPKAGAGLSTQSKQAIDQNIAYTKGGFAFNIGYLNIDKAFTVDSSLLGSSSNAQSVASLKDMLSKAGQSGINTGLSYAGGGNKFGLKFSSIAQTMQDQQQTSDTLTFEHDFNKAFNLGFTRTDIATDPTGGGSASHVSTDVLHLAYSLSRTGLQLDGTSTRTLTDNGGTSNDLLFNVAQHFAKINLTSQFESSESVADGSAPNDFTNQKFGLTGPLSNTVSFTSSWDRKTIAGAPGVDDFDATIKAAETKYITLAAEYCKNDDIPNNEITKQTLTANINSKAGGPLGALLYTLSISNQQVQLLDGLMTASAGVQGLIHPTNNLDFMSGVKFYLACVSATSSVPGSKRSSHTARTLRLVSGPAGKNGLTWTVSQQQRLDQNGQPLHTASDYELKDAVNSKLSIGVSELDQAAQPDGSYNDLDQQTLSIGWTRNAAQQYVAQYFHSNSISQDIASEDGYLLNYSGPIFGSKKVGLGLGESRKIDPTGAGAFGTTADLTYAWTAGTSDLLNVTSHLTDWQNHGFDGDYSPSVEEAGQLNFQKTF